MNIKVIKTTNFLKKIGEKWALNLNNDFKLIAQCIFNGVDHRFETSTYTPDSSINLAKAEIENQILEASKKVGSQETLNFVYEH